MRAVVYKGPTRSGSKTYPLSLDEAPDADENFDQRAKGWTKVVLKPEQNAS